MNIKILDGGDASRAMLKLYIMEAVDRLNSVIPARTIKK
jgi:hypothetical protein